MERHSSHEFTYIHLKIAGLTKGSVQDAMDAMIRIGADADADAGSNANVGNR